MSSLTVVFVLLALSAVLLALLIRANGRLQRAAERARVREEALDTLPQAIFVVDSLHGPGRPICINAAYSALTGYPTTEVLGGAFDAFSIFADPAVATLGSG